MNKFRNIFLLLFAFVPTAAFCTDDYYAEQFKIANENAKIYEQVSGKVKKVLHAVLREADPKTALIPNFFPLKNKVLSKREKRNQNVYSPHHSGADLYPFLVLGAYFTDESLVDGKMMEMLRSEVKHSNFWRQLPIDYDLKKEKRGKPTLFGAAEYAKDGLISITERLGRNAWYFRMHDMMIDLMVRGHVKTKFGDIPSEDTELNGDVLQVLPRLYWMTGDPRFLEWNRRISDAYIYEILPGNFGLPSEKWNFGRHQGSSRIKLRDHGNETIVGLAMAFALEKMLNSERVGDYQKALTIMFDKLIASANADGLLYDVISAKTLKPESDELADNWGYVYGAIYNFYLMTGEEKYKQAIVKVLSNLPKYVNYPWQGKHYDGIADSVEGAISLVNREANSEVNSWIDQEMLRIFKDQKADGHVDRSYLEGNFIRTSLLYMNMKSQGVSISNWTSGVGVGAVKKDAKLFLSLKTAHSAKAVVRFDYARHKKIFNLPINLVRLNETPEWFVVDENLLYEVSSVINSKVSSSRIYLGSELKNGISLEKGNWIISPWVAEEKVQ